MFNTPYNKKISDEMNALNRKFVKHAEDSGRMVKDVKMSSSIVKQPQMTAQAGAGIFSHLLHKIGLGEPMDGGACGCAGVGRRRGRPSKSGGAMTGTAMTGGKKKIIHRRVGKGDLEGAGIFSGLLSKIGLGEGELSETESMKGSAMTGGRRRGRPSMKHNKLGMGESTILDGGMKKKGKTGKGIFSGLLSQIGLGETGGAMTGGRHPSMKHNKLGMGETGGAMTGGAYGLNMVRKMGEGKQRGRPSKKTGKGGLMDIVDSVSNLFGGMPSTPLEQIAGPKLTQQFKNIGREIVGDFAGMGKKKKRVGGEWVNFVKSWSKTNNMKYNEALKDKRVSMAYKNRK